jgi:hypothetical protein
MHRVEAHIGKTVMHRFSFPVFAASTKSLPTDGKEQTVLKTRSNRQWAAQDSNL